MSQEGAAGSREQGTVPYSWVGELVSVGAVDGPGGGFTGTLEAVTEGCVPKLL